MLEKALISHVVDKYCLPLHGIHGIGHWVRVWENGLRLASANDSDTYVVELFALFHDSRRANEGRDREHGQRGADFALKLKNDGRLAISGNAFDKLYYACVNHTNGLTQGDITVQTCWDADRLDLGRVGTIPKPRRLCTVEAKKPETIQWALDRSTTNEPVDLLFQKWGI